jgi:MoaA/NifB/PqqE/SkfB family radical SAM enzyme
MEVLKPVVVQVSGGEPLMRDDLEDVVRAIRQPNGLPFLILVSNWSEMTEERYLALHEAGVNQFSVSLDFPDTRHDDYRGHPGLYDHLAEVVPLAARHGFDDICLNNCITAENVDYINAAADKAKEWGVNINYSAYSPRRTGCREHFPSTPEQMASLHRGLAQLRTRIDSRWVTNSITTLDATEHYFETGSAPGCQAGRRWLVVTSDGQLQPCSMQFHRFDLMEQDRMIREFTSKNTCDECYVAIRSSLDKPFAQLLRENLVGFFSFGSGTSKAAC